MKRLEKQRAKAERRAQKKLEKRTSDTRTSETVKVYGESGSAAVE